MIQSSAFRVTDVEEGVPGRLAVVVVPFEHEDLLPALVREIQVLNLLLPLGEGLAFLLLLAQLAHLLQERLLRELLLLKVVLVVLVSVCGGQGGRNELRALLHENHRHCSRAFAIVIIIKHHRS